MDERETDLREYVGIVFRRWYLLVSAMAIFGLAAMALRPQFVLTYNARARLLVTQNQRSVILPGPAMAVGNLQSIVTKQPLDTKTFAELINSRPTAARVVRELGLSMTAEELMAKFKATPVVDTRLVDVIVIDSVPERPVRIANAIGRISTTLAGTVTGREDDAPTVRVVEPAATATSPSAPPTNPVGNLVLGLVAGAMIGAAGAFVTEFMDASVKGAKDVERVLGLPVVGQIPRYRPAGSTPVVVSESTSSAGEAYRGLRANLQHMNTDNELRIIGVTSPHAGEGASAVAANLAAVLALGGAGVVLIDCNLRHPTGGADLGISAERTLSNLLAGDAEFDEVITPTLVPGLEAVVAAPVSQNSADLLSSRKMAQLLDLAREKADFVIADSPAVLAATDAAALAPFVDGFLLAIRARKTNRHDAAEARTLLEQAGGKVVGVVLTGVDVRRGGAYRYRKGDRAGRPEPASRVDRETSELPQSVT